MKEPPPGSPPGTSPTSEDLTAESTVVNLMAAHSDAASAVVACVGAEARVKSADMMIISVDTAGVLTPSPLPHETAVFPSGPPGTTKRPEGRRVGWLSPGEGRYGRPAAQ